VETVPDAQMRTRVRVAALVAGFAGLLAASAVLWVIAFLGQSSDGPAFTVALVVVVLIPTLLAPASVVPVEAESRWTRVTATAAVGACGVVAAGVEADFFAADAPADPAFIHWVAAVPPFAFFAAVLLVGLVVWRLLLPLSPLPRTVLTVVAALIGPIVVTLVPLTGMPLIVLTALAAPVVLIAVGVVTARRQRQQIAA
jgi:hypothetical protein